MPAAWQRHPPPLLLRRTPEEIIAMGRLLGVPEISTQWDADHVLRIVYHWDHGDRVIYPDLTEREDTPVVDPSPTRPYRPQPGDIGITRISGVGGAAIRAAQWLNGDGFTDLEHAFVFVGPVRGRDGDDWIIEAMPNGARLIRNWHDPERTVYLRCPGQYRAAVAQAALACEHVPYSWADYGALGLHRLHIPYPHLKHYISASGHMICSQLADFAADRGGWHLYNDHRWCGDVTPGDLYLLYVAQRAQRIKHGDMSR